MPSHPDSTCESFPLSRRDFLELTGLGSLGLLVPGLLTGCGDDDLGVLGSPSYAATILDGQAAIRQALVDTNTPSISVALVDDQRVIWAEAFGVIDKEQGLAPTTETQFCIGSCSKVLAAMATMILVERGLVELDEPLVTYVPDFTMLSPEADAITIRQLLSHASGLPGTNFNNIFSQTPNPDYAARTQFDLADQRLKHDPGEMAVCCNDGFTLIEDLVAAVTGQSYARFVTTEILVPAGMTLSAYPQKPFPAGTFAPAFSEDTQLPQEFTNGFATGGLYATPSDMGRVARLLLQGGVLEGRRILSAASVAEMARDQSQTIGFNPIPSFQWGLGWDDVSQKGLAAVGVKAWTKNGGTLLLWQSVLCPARGAFGAGHEWHHPELWQRQAGRTHPLQCLGRDGPSGGHAGAPAGHPRARGRRRRRDPGGHGGLLCPARGRAPGGGPGRSRLDPVHLSVGCLDRDGQGPQVPDRRHLF